jgi:hypothetical protein
MTGPVALRDGGLSSRSPLLEENQGRTPMERRMRSVAFQLDSVLLCQQLCLWQR